MEQMPDRSQSETINCPQCGYKLDLPPPCLEVGDHVSRFSGILEIFSRQRELGDASPHSGPVATTNPSGQIYVDTEPVYGPAPIPAGRDEEGRVRYL